MRYVSILSVLGVFAAGCGSGSGGTSDPDYKDVYPYVVKQIMVPETVGHAQMVARDIDGDGKKENTLGQFFAFLQTMAIPHGCEQTVNSTISKGLTLVLLQAKANLTAAGRLGSGASGDGGAAGDPAVLLMTAGKDANNDASDNFDGAGVFFVDEKYKAKLSGVISAMALRAGRGKGFLPLAPGGEVRTYTLLSALLEGKLTPDRLDDGVLSGGIPWNEFKMLMMPGLASVLNCVVNNPVGGGG